MAPDTEKKKPDNRWWEFYFVRYFVGTAIGAIVVLFLATDSSPVFTNQGALATILKLLRPEKFESGYIAVLATVGLAFCFIASAPILVFHSVRGSFHQSGSWKNRKVMAWFSITLLIVTGLQLAMLWSALSIKGNPILSPEFYKGIAFTVFVSLLFVVQLFLLWLEMFGQEKHAFEYYENLVKRRASASAAGNEFIESYRHLREHGNAFFAVLLELLLGAVLFYTPLPWAVILMLWIFPAAVVWLFGTLMESRII